MRKERFSMKKSYILQDLDCAVCAAKIEKAVSEIEGVDAVSVSFMAQKMTIDASEDKHADIIKQAKKLIKKIEPDCSLIV